jgi:hypothetical protein
VRILLGLVVAFLCASSLARADVLVAGEPPLTQEMVDQTGDFLEWAFDLQLTSEQRGDTKAIMLAAWKKKDRAAIDSVNGILAARTKLLDLAPDVRQAAQQKVQPQLVQQLKSSPKDPTSRWLLGVYDSAHTPLVGGAQPLTRQMIDAYAELVGFIVGVASTGNPVMPDRTFKDGLRKSMVAGWKKVDAAQKEQLAHMPLYWAAIRTQWATTSEQDKATYREQWAKALGGLAASSKRTPEQQLVELQKQMMLEKARHDMTMRMLDAIGCATSNCTWKYEYRWVRKGS